MSTLNEDGTTAKQTLSVEEVSEVLNCSRDLVYREIKKGTIPHVKLGRVYRVPSYALNVMLNGATGGVSTNDSTE
tara:strand:- start:2460 stop:2684 length:225 start_codon:yes stop_codon:yes gene_type:complete